VRLGRTSPVKKGAAGLGTTVRTRDRKRGCGTRPGGTKYGGADRK
jgi:hypothetical protein